ncbi:hypothetical protein [Mycobacterium timonense]|uniref:Uncharacterized protein n=1 Tax=Mycobacterium timonense TaxID=701043 RepID=A0ABX3TCG6_9MYCO|nr:hypothetical protein [Mycobacterium timonense]ORB76494.1 hypothetical protein BST46_29785 [Mycobacterium timonense]
MQTIIEAEVTDVYLTELRAEFPELSLTVSPGQTRLRHGNRAYHRRIEGPAADIRVVSDRLSMAGLSWTTITSAAASAATQTPPHI